MAEEALKPLAAIDSSEGVVRDSDAEYTLEYAATCPRCGETIKTLRVIRLLRTRVNFVSTLPRRGRVLACPLCRAVVSGELTIG
jgi:hypothetical protein